MSLPANDLVWDGVHGFIYLSVPSAAGPGGNVIAAVDPVSGLVVATQFAGSEPDVLAISGDGQYLYAGIDGSASVARFQLPSLTPDITYALGADSFFGPYRALDLQVAPAAAHTTAVTRQVFDFSPSAQGGVRIYDDATARPVATQGFGGTGYLFDSLQWGADATQLVAANNEDTGFDYYTLAVDASGVKLVHDYPNTFNRFFARIHYDAGDQRVYSDDGHVITPANGQPIGTFAASGPMVPDSAANTAYFAVSNQIVAFDQSHFTPLSTTAYDNVNATPRHLIRWGASGLAFSTSNGPVFLTGSNGSTTQAPYGQVPLGQATVTKVAINANDIAWDAVHNLIYASLPSTASSMGNSVVAIDPLTGLVGASQFAGSEPDVLAVSDDGQYLYAGINGAASIQRFLLPALTPDILYALGSSSFSGPYHALDLVVAPGAPHTVAVSRAVYDSSPAAQGGVEIFDDGVARPTRAKGFGPDGGGGVLYDSLQWGSDATALYSANNEDSGFDFYALKVNGSGVQLDKSFGYIFPSYFGRIHYDKATGIVYDDDGYTAIPGTGMPPGVFLASGVMVPDGASNLAYFLGQSNSGSSSDYVIISFDMSRYTPVAGIVLHNITDTPSRLIRWGDHGLAFATASGVYLVNGAFVGQTSHARASSYIDASVKRSWNSSLRRTGPIFPERVDLHGRRNVERQPDGSCLLTWGSFVLRSPAAVWGGLCRSDAG